MRPVQFVYMPWKYVNGPGDEQPFSRAKAVIMLRIGLCFLLIAGCSSQNSTESPPVSVEAETQPILVEAHRASEIPEGFRGDVHPLLTGAKLVDVVAFWTPVGTGRGLQLGYFPEQFYGSFRELRVAEARRTYTASHFSAFLPKDDDLGSVGRMWAVDLEKVSDFLSQFHPGISMKVRSTGRRAGPNGGFAMLRAVSPTHAEIVFRVHAEIDVAPGLFYTPAHFSGSLIVNKQSGTIENFELGIPTDRTLNVTLSAILPREALIEIVLVRQMELRSIRDAGSLSIDWAEALDLAEARHKLKEAFYGFMEIDWVPAEQALSLARKNDKPIFAVVTWGAIDDQSC